MMAVQKDQITRLIRVLAPVLVLVLAIGLATGMGRLRPAPEKEEAVNRFPAVQYQTVEVGPLRLAVQTQGTVQASTETILTSEVSGLIEWVDPRFADGGFFEAGEVMLRIDPLEYEARLAEAKVRLAQAELQLEQERAQSEQAARDWEALGRGEPSPLVLRRPQLARAEAEAEAARAQVAIAERNLAFTEIRAPYSGRILRKEVDVGQAVAARSTRLARFYDIEVAEIRLPVTSRDHAQIEIPEIYRDAASPTVFPPVTLWAEIGGRRYQWEGILARAEGVVDTRSRLSYVVVQVKNPYARRGGPENPFPPLKVGQFVEAEILGRLLESAVQLPRDAVHPGNRVYVVGEENRLYSRQVTVERVDGGTAIISEGLESGDRVCLTPLLFFVEGMQVAPEPVLEAGEGEGGVLEMN